MARDLNAELRQAMDRRLDRAVCKGVNRLEDHYMELVFEKDGETIVLHVHSEGGIAPSVRVRT